MKLFMCALEVHYDIRDGAIDDLLKAYQSNTGKGSEFQIHFRSKKDKQESITKLKRYWGQKKGALSFLRTMKSVKPLPEVLLTSD
jgi:hypothetical protein